MTRPTSWPYCAIERESIKAARGSWLYNFTVDDITLVAVGDTIDVPVGTDIAALLASAESDGKGGTILTHASGKLELLGVDPNTASTAWFHVGQG